MDNLSEFQLIEKYSIHNMLSIIEETNNDTIVLATALLAMKQKKKKQRRGKWFRRRLNWDEHVGMTHNERRDGFQRRYHMSEASFKKLVELLRPHLSVDERQSRRSTGGNLPISVESVVACGLRYLGGEFVKTLADAFGIAVSTIYQKITSFLVAVDKTFKIDMPTSHSELRKCANEWSSLSSAFGIYDGCVGAIDGWLCCINSPTIHNPVHYFSGHYQRSGLNVQAVCDANLRFLYFAVVAPGRTGDARAFNSCLKLQNWLENLPKEYFLVGDNAYPLSDKMLVPFQGATKHVKFNRSYNFYLSQLRIRVEMAFGRLTTQWRIFRRNIETDLIKTSLICNAAAKLHNFVIENDNIRFSKEGDSIDDFSIDPLNNCGRWNKGYLTTLPTLQESGIIEKEDRRNKILDEIVTMQLERPIENLIRNEELDAPEVYEN